MIVLLLGALAVALIAVFAGSAGRSSPPLASRPAPRPADDDPVEMLARYGTPDDAARLIADGHGDDLAGLGYHAGDDQAA